MAMTLIFCAVLSCVWQPASATPPQAPPSVIRATGVGYPPRRVGGARARLLARRAAEVVAQRNLALKVGRTCANSKASQIVSRTVRARLGGLRYVGERDLPNGGVEVTVEYRPAQPVRRTATTGWSAGFTSPGTTRRVVVWSQTSRSCRR